MKRAVSILGVIAALAVGATVYALPASEVEIIYFSDASLTNEVGYRLLACQGGIYREGRTSRHYVRFQSPCSTGSLNEIACILNGVETACPANICESHLVTCG